MQAPPIPCCWLTGLWWYLAGRLTVSAYDAYLSQPLLTWLSPQSACTERCHVAAPGLASSSPGGSSAASLSRHPISCWPVCHVKMSAPFVPSWCSPGAAASGAADNLPVVPQPLFICITQAGFCTAHPETTSMQTYAGVFEDVALEHLHISAGEGPRAPLFSRVKGETIAYLSGTPNLQCYQE